MTRKGNAASLFLHYTFRWNPNKNPNNSLINSKIRLNLLIVLLFNG